MSTAQLDEQRKREILDAFESDLRSIACRAAIELDNLILRRGNGLHGLGRLVSTIEESFTSIEKPASPDSLLNPTTAVVMNSAIRDSFAAEPLKSIQELVERAKGIVGQLRRVLDAPDAFRTERPDELTRMRTFCLALSKRASALQPSRHNVARRYRFRR